MISDDDPTIRAHPFSDLVATQVDPFEWRTARRRIDATVHVEGVEEEQRNWPMIVGDKVTARIKGLIADARGIGFGEDGVARDETHIAECKAWMVSTLHVVELVCSSDGNAYAREARKMVEATKTRPALMPADVQALRMVLERLQKDIDDGLLVSIENQATAIAFDDFLDHADEYLNAGQKNEASVIAGVVFEDTIRRICQANTIKEAGEKLDTLISNLAKIGKLSVMKAKRARAAAGLRNSATHAQWSKIDLSDVKPAIDLTRELLSDHLGE